MSSPPPPLTPAPSRMARLAWPLALAAALAPCVLGARRGPTVGSVLLQWGQKHTHGLAGQEAKGAEALPDAHIAVVTVCYPDHAASSESFPAADTAGFSAFCEASHRNKEKFCRRHGCQLFFVTEPQEGLEGREAAYNKWLVMRSAFQRPDVTHVLFMDADALFMNFATPISSLLPRDGKHITMNGDANALLNDGVLLFSKSNVTEQLTQELWDLYPPPRPWGGQSALIYIFTGKQARCRQATDYCNKLPLTEAWSRECDVRDKREMNAYISEFVPGDFILHFAGSGDAKFDLMKKYSGTTVSLTFLMVEYSARAVSHESPVEELAKFHSRIRAQAGF